MSPNKLGFHPLNTHLFSFKDPPIPFSPYLPHHSVATFQTVFRSSAPVLKHSSNLFRHHSITHFTPKTTNIKVHNSLTIRQCNNRRTIFSPILFAHSTSIHNKHTSIYKIVYCEYLSKLSIKRKPASKEPLTFILSYKGQQHHSFLKPQNTNKRQKHPSLLNFPRT